MPAHNAEITDPKTVLRILLALVIEQGGEVRVKATSYDRLDRGRLLTVDFDGEAGQIVLRASTEWGRAVVVQPEAASWSQPANAAPRERARVAAEEEAAHRSIHTDEELADMEDKAARAQAVAAAVARGETPLQIRTVK
jgi:hypothetical protein